MTILNSWQHNATAWIQVMEQESIASRKVTNPAIFEVIQQYQPTRLLDVGCGEGWLTRACIEKGIPTVGVDGTAMLMERAKAQHLGDFYCLTYEELIATKTLPDPPYEAAVFNFCLYEKEGVFNLLQMVAEQLTGRKLLFLQTLHPNALIGGEIPYKDQWIADSWAGLSGQFSQPHAWYFRTLSSWIKLFKSVHLTILDIEEPIATNSPKPVSIIFVLQVDT